MKIHTEVLHRPPWLLPSTTMAARVVFATLLALALLACTAWAAQVRLQ